VASTIRWRGVKKTKQIKRKFDQVLGWNQGELVQSPDPGLVGVFFLGFEVGRAQQKHSSNTSSVAAASLTRAVRVAHRSRVVVVLLQSGEASAAVELGTATALLVAEMLAGVGREQSYSNMSARVLCVVGTL